MVGKAKNYIYSTIGPVPATKLTKGALRDCSMISQKALPPAAPALAGKLLQKWNGGVNTAYQAILPRE